MKKNSIKIIVVAILSLFIFMGFLGTINAAGSSIYVSPASVTKNPGDIFNVSLGFNALGNKVCAVEGTLVFNNLTCQSILLSSDVVAQASPTCSNPHFLIGVPNCTALDKVLLTLSVRAGNAGTASIMATGVDIIGEGVSVGSNAMNGSYTIIAAPKEPKNISVPEVEETIQEVVEPKQEAVQDIESPAQEVDLESSLPPEDIQASLPLTSLNNSNYIWVGIIIIIVGLSYYFIRKRKK